MPDPHLVLALPVHILHQDVHVYSERDVLQHQEDIRHRDGEQDQVDWIASHLLVPKHNDVEEVEKCSKHTDDDGEIAVCCSVRVLRSQN